MQMGEWGGNIIFLRAMHRDMELEGSTWADTNLFCKYSGHIIMLGRGSHCTLKLGEDFVPF